MVTPERAATLLDAIETNVRYARRKVAAGRFGELHPYAAKMRAFLDELDAPLVPAHVEPERVPYAEAPLPTGYWGIRDVTAGAIWGRLFLPNPMRDLAPLVITIPGGPGPMPRWEHMDSIAKRLIARGVPVLAWDWRTDGLCVDDVRRGLREAVVEAGGRQVVMVAHSLGGFPATIAAFLDGGPDAYVAVSAITSRDQVGQSLLDVWGPLDPRQFGARRIPITVIGATDDLVVPPARMADFADALATAGHSPRYLVVEGANHDTVLTATATVEAVLKGA